MNKKLWATVAFVMVVGGVLITFMFLGSQGGPPPMTPGPHHKLRFDLNKDLIGVETDPVVDLLNSPPITDKKAVEKRVNTGCTQCHAKLPDHHPPKTECIKCHRMAASSAPVSTTGGPATATANPAPATAPNATPSALGPDAGAAAASVDAGSAAVVDAGAAP
jgi:hypothetical protein